MKRPAAFFALLACLGGCHAPTPSMNLLAPYGTPRVPAPATGSYGTPGGYYQPPASAPATTPAVGTGLRASQATGTRWTENQTGSRGRVAGQTGATASTVKPLTAGQADSDGGPVQPASFETPPGRIITPSVASNSRVRIVDGPARAARSTTQLRGMPINDATRPAEPARFEPPAEAIDISQLPVPTASATSVRSASPSGIAARSGDRTGTLTAGSASPWQARSIRASSTRNAVR